VVGREFGRISLKPPFGFSAKADKKFDGIVNMKLFSELIIW